MKVLKPSDKQVKPLKKRIEHTKNVNRMKSIKKKDTPTPLRAQSKDAANIGTVCEGVAEVCIGAGKKSNVLPNIFTTNNSIASYDDACTIVRDVRTYGLPSINMYVDRGTHFASAGFDTLDTVACIRVCDTDAENTLGFDAYLLNASSNAIEFRVYTSPKRLVTLCTHDALKVSKNLTFSCPSKCKFVILTDARNLSQLTTYASKVSSVCATQSE